MEYLFSMLVLCSLYVMLSASFNLIIGYGGLISVAHPIFFAIGAYVSALTAMHFGIPSILAVLIGGAAATLASAAISLPSLRVSGDYLLVTSIGFQLGLLQIVKNLEVTGGPGGLTNIPSTITGEYRSPAFAAIAVVLATATVLMIRWLMRGPYGRAITAMRDDELAFTALGRNATLIKIVIFALGSGMAGIAGGVYAFFYQYVSPEQFEILQSALILTMVVVGGISTTWGPVVGAVLLLALPQAITFIHMPPNVSGGLQGMLYTLLVLVFMFARPQGIIAAKRARL